ncbi:MAG: hypothetical protein ACRCZ2_08540 [Fusobacteriaceae bacterium]
MLNKKKLKFNVYAPYVIIILGFHSGYKLEEIFMLFYLSYYILKENLLELKIDYKILGIILFVSIISILKATLNNYPLSRTFEQIVLLLVMFLGYSHFFKKNGIKKMTSIYLDISYWVSILGILQFIIFYLVRIDIIPHPLTSSVNVIGQRFPGIIRARSIGFEAGIIAQTLIPATCLSITGFFKTKSKKRKKRYFTIFIMFILTLSSGGYVALPFYFIIKELKRKNPLKTLNSVLFISLLGILTKNIWYEKIFETFGAISGLKTGIFKDINASSFSTLSNLYIALNNKNLYFGTGLGTHPYSYFENFKDRPYIPIYHFYGLNAPEAYSIFTRSLSEMGLIFVILFITGLGYKFNKRQNYLGEINAAALTGIISFFIRGGLYTRFGTTLIILMYFYSGRGNNAKRFKNRFFKRNRNISSSIGSSQ